MANGIKRVLQATKDTLFANPKLLYKHERHLLNQPFLFEGTNGKAVLLLHGWTVTPYEVRRLGTFLNAHGYTVHAPLLSGHGTVPKDLENVGWQDWLLDAETAYADLKQRHTAVYVGGTSIGGTLTLLLAAKFPDIAGLILMATPYRMRHERLGKLVVRITQHFKRYTKKFYPPTFGLSTTITRLIAYQTYPLQSALEAGKVIELGRTVLPQVKQPVLILQSAHDHLIPRESTETLYKRLGSKVKIKKYIQRAYHTFISDVKNEHVFEDILQFLQDTNKHELHHE